jgi:hypothetical protein
MKRRYTEAPSDWDMALRENLSAARRAYAMEGPPLRRTLLRAQALGLLCACLLLAVLAVGLAAR